MADEPAAPIEAARLDVLRGLGLSPGTSGAANEATRFAALLCETPIALVSLVDDERQYFVGRTGLDIVETPRDQSFCAHTMLGDDLMVIPDARVDPRFVSNMFVTGHPFIRFYAGMPLVSREGYPLGSLCVIDPEPREGLTDLQRQGLKILARGVMLGLESRRGVKERAASELRAARALSDVEQRFHILADTMPQMVWSALPDGYNDYFNARWYEFSGLPEGSADGEGWEAIIHPDDLAETWTRWRHSLETGELYETEYRLRHHSGEYRWALGRAQPIRDEDGHITRWFGTCTDIHEQKLLYEQREVVARELSHRIKNIFSVISGLIGLSARAHPEISVPAAELRERVLALGRAHELGRLRAAGEEPGTTKGVRTLLTALLAPYRTDGGDRFEIAGPDLAVDDRAATPLALLCHELATNAAKYGALSTPGGRVLVTLSADGEDCAIEWRECGGPSVIAPTHEGFGSRLIALSIERQLGGRIERDWQTDGLRVRLDVPLRALRRDAEARG